ncbi:hypothetical protein FOQG_00244 [Fusarium oxysporum f. sp. raphani 54005]|uniref:Uncharacterized protein n=3 Tax=Fusarium oxysporum TaxID=5507 RepID=X0D8G6_FUSOX|nr:hypothetical protein FOQG_00244 [Fusarium oxysporum f. sp. raphani 54005]EXL82290.1 hypothetical protein FOPG_04877 [Fusarium oxysporum f. sp. conglutinans race 2 54008]EXM35860.1 hypothetical protein FOTG_00234 [Fusarium oxysporum f. sp. vasinfectum 25433]
MMGPRLDDLRILAQMSSDPRLLAIDANGIVGTVHDMACEPTQRLSYTPKQSSAWR